MDDKEFKRLGRAELIEIIYQLQKKEQQLTSENQEMKNKLADRERKVKLENAGSIAVETLQIYDIFNAAQNAADKYVTEVKKLCAESEECAVTALSKAQFQAEILIKKAEQDCAAMRQHAEQEIQSKWGEFQKKVEEVLNARSELVNLLNFKDTAEVKQNE